MNLARIPRPLKILTILYLAYLALVLLIATPLLNIFAPKIYREQSGLELTLAKAIWLNPFTLSATVRQASSTNVDHSPFWSFDEFSADVSIASLLRGHLVLDALTLHGLDVQITQTTPHRFNFNDVLDYRTQHAPIQQVPIQQVSARQNAAQDVRPAPSPDTATTEPFALEIGEINFTAKHLGYRAPHASVPVNASLRDLRLTIPTFSTTTNFDYTFSALDDSGGSVQINGTAAFAQKNTTGHAQLRSISLLPAWQYLANKLAFDMNAAQLDGDIHYTVSWGGPLQHADTIKNSSTLRYSLDQSRFSLHNVQLQARNDSKSRLEFAALHINALQVDSTPSRARIGSVLLDKLSVAGWNQGTHISLVDMFAFASQEGTSVSPPWQIQIDDIALQNGDIRWHASQLSHLPLAFAPLDIHASNLHWPDAAPLQLHMSATLNNTAQLALNGEVTPSTQNGELQADVRNLPLAWGDVFVRRQMRATLTSGALNARATIQLDKAQPVSIKSDGSIDQFGLHALPQQTPTDKRKLMSWQKLEWQQLALDLVQQQLTAQQIVVTQPWAQFRINADGTHNFQQLMLQPGNSSAAVSSTTVSTATASTEKPWQFAIDNINVDRATIDFRDASLIKAFRTNFTELSGNILGLNNSTVKNRAAKVALKGTVDGYAPVALTGTVNPFAATPTLDITLDMTNIDLAMLTPYSGTYAGYHIDGGRLSVQMVYTLENNRIKGTNHIVVNQMQLGKQVSGPKVMDLPLRLAIYLLTDSNGVMDLGVDVTGNVDDPDFSVGSIIWKAFRNLIVKTATSPFRALANLIGNNRDDLDRIEFQVGSHQLAAGEDEKLQSVSKALLKKPDLKLHITGHVSPTRDLEALRDTSLSAQLIAQGGITAMDIQQQSKSWQREVLKLFKQRFPAEKSDQWQVMQMNDAMRDNIELAPNALQELAAQRALTLKQTLVADLGLAAGRAFTKPSDLGTDKDPGPFATMTVE